MYQRSLLDRCMWHDIPEDEARRVLGNRANLLKQGKELVQSLERYGFECEAGGLESCTEFQQLVDLLRQAGAEAPAHV